MIYIARITAVEVTSAVARRRKGRTLPSKNASSILCRFRQHLAGRYTIVEITPALFNEAMRLANTPGALCAYDAVQLAAALEINQKEQDAGFAPVTMVSADLPLNTAASWSKVWPLMTQPLIRNPSWIGIGSTNAITPAANRKSQIQVAQSSSIGPDLLHTRRAAVSPLAAAAL